MHCRACNYFQFLQPVLTLVSWMLELARVCVLTFLLFLLFRVFCFVRCSSVLNFILLPSDEPSATDIATLPTARYFPDPAGEMVVRNGWDLSDNSSDTVVWPTPICICCSVPSYTDIPSLSSVLSSLMCSSLFFLILLDEFLFLFLLCLCVLASRQSCANYVNKRRSLFNST